MNIISVTKVIPGALTSITINLIPTYEWSHLYSLFYFLMLIGILSILVHTQDITRYLISIELLLFVITFYFVIVFINTQDTKGVVYIIFIITLSTSEVVVGLTLLIKVSYRIRLVI
jgi:NADH:ubiquinone oxidoreductase subunit K